MNHTRRIIFLIGALSLLFLGMPTAAFAEGPTFPPEIQVPLEINEKGFVSKFLEPGFTIAATQTLDVDKDDVPDYIVFYATKGDLSIGLVHNYGQGPGRYGPAIFYFIRNARGEIVEWAGNPTWAHRPPSPTHRIPSPGPPAPPRGRIPSHRAFAPACLSAGSSHAAHSAN